MHFLVSEAEMISQKIFPMGSLLVNTIIAWDNETSEGILVDPAGNLDEVLSFAEQKDIRIKYIVNTHEHPDHTAKNAWAKILFKDAKLLMHEKAAENLNRWVQTDIGQMVGAEFSPPPDKTLRDGDTINFGSEEVMVIHTPGHSPGSICLIGKEHDIAIVGDLIFKGGIGRYDLPGGNYDELEGSIVKLFSLLKPKTIIIPGHGRTTTVDYELKNNPYIVRMFR